MKWDTEIRTNVGQRALSLLFGLLLATSSFAQLPVTQWQFDTSPGWQTRGISDAPYTNYFAVRPFSTNFVSVGALAGAASASVDYDWYGGYGAWDYTTNVTQPVLPLAPGGAGFSLMFTNLYPGAYGVQLFGVVTNDLPAQSVRLPLIWKIVANDGPYGETNTYHIVQNYMPGKCYDIGQFWVQAIKAAGASNNIVATVSLSAASEVSVHLVSIHFFAPVDYSDTTVYKTDYTLYTGLERANSTNNAATNTSSSTLVDWRNNSPAVPYVTSDNRTNLFNRWKPLNSMTDEAGGTYATNVAGSAVWLPTPHHGDSDYLYATDFASPWGWTNAVTQQGYSLQDWLNGTAVPGTTNDYVGFYYTNGAWVSTFGAQNGYYLYRSFVLPMLLTSLPPRYYYFPAQTNVAHAAGLMLAKFAVVYPTYRLEAQDINSNMKNPSAYLDIDQGRWSLRRTGKFEYDGWASDTEGQILYAIDYLWPYVCSSQPFADDVSLFLPWISGNTNNVKLLFQNLIRSLAFDTGYRSQGGNPMLIGLALQSGSTSSNLMNPVVTTVNVVPATAEYANWKKTYAGTYTRDGANLIGSSMYLPGENVLLKGPELTARYKANGGQVGSIDISTASAWPKLGAFVDWYVDNRVAYGFDASFGDAGMSIHEGPGVENGSNDSFLMQCWEVNNSPRLAKYIVDVRGRIFQSDAQWNAIVAAATVDRDLRWPVHSRIWGGVGLGILEHGIGATNQLETGAAVLRTVSGYGHDHGDHLDLNIYALGARMGTDIAQRNEGANVTYPNATATRVHNVVEVDGYNHMTSANNGWPGGNTEGGYSQYTLFSTNGNSQVIGATLWNAGRHTNVDYQHRDLALTKIDATNFYVVDFQRVNGGRFHSWSFHGADVAGEADGFTASVSLTNTPLDFTDDAACNPAFFMRKHATNSAYALKAYEGGAGAEFWAEWRLGRTATVAGTILNGDGNGGETTAIAPEQAMYGASYSAGSPRKVIRATLFDRTNDLVGSGWLFSSYYHLLQPRIYVFTPGTKYFTNLTERSGTWAALYDAYETSRAVTAETSLATDSTLTNAFQPKVLEVTTAAGVDRHFNSATNLDVVADGDTFNGSYGFIRRVGGVVTELKLAGGTKLIAGSISLTATTNYIVAAIGSANYTNQSFSLSEAWPGVKRLGWHRIRNANHETSYYLTAWPNTTNASYSGDALCGELDMASVSGNTITFSSAAGGMVLADYPKRGTGVTLANEARTKLLHVNYAASTTATRTDGDTVTIGDFADSDGDGFTSALLYDFGPGDTLEQPTEVWIRKNSDTSYTVAANTGFTFSGFDSDWSIGGQTITGGAVETAYLTGEPQEVTKGLPRYTHTHGSGTLGSSTR